MKQSNLWQYFVTCITKKYATFYGRADYAEFLGFMFFFFVLFFGLCSLGSILFPEAFPEFGQLTLSDRPIGVLPLGYWWFSVFVMLALLIPFFAVCVRRLHDAGYSGVNLCWCFIPIFGQVTVLFLLLSPPYNERNPYGVSQSAPPQPRSTE